MRLDYKWQAALISALGLFMAVLDNTIVNVALPQMIKSFHTNLTTIEWVVTGYFLAQAAVIPVTGYLSDRIGTKTVFLSALAVFTLGSGLCAIAPTEQALIGFRVLQGIGGGALFPIAFAIVFRAFPPAQRGAAGAVIGVPVLLAPAFGPTIGGFLTTSFNWNAIFTINVPIGIVALILGFLVLQGRASERAAGEGQPAAGGRFDVPGFVLSIASFTILVYGITEAATYGWNNTPFTHFTLFGLVIEVSVVRALIVGGALLVAFVVTELLSKDPVMDVRLFTNYTFTVANVLMWGISGLLFGSIFLLPLFFENVRGLSALNTGEILIAQGVAAAVTTVIAGRLYNSVGPRILATIGFLLIAAGTYGFTQLDLQSSGQSVQFWLVLRGFGLGLTNIPLQTLALSVVSNRAMARASSLSTVTRQVAGAVGIAAISTYLTQQVADRVKSVATTFQTTQLGAAQSACAAAHGRNIPALTACVKQAATNYVGPHAFVLGLDNTFVLLTVATGACVILALLVGRDPAVEAVKQAAARGESVATSQPAIVGE